MQIELRTSCLGSGSGLAWLVLSVHDLAQMEATGNSRAPREPSEMLNEALVHV